MEMRVLTGGGGYNPSYIEVNQFLLYYLLNLPNAESIVLQRGADYGRY